MEDTHEVEGQLMADETFISDKKIIQELELKGYGEFTKEQFFLKPCEALFLLYSNKLILKKGKKQIDFDELMNLYKKNDQEILTKFLIYRDLRTKGYVVKDGFGFGSDFRVYDRGHYGEKGAKFLIFGFNEGQQEKVGNLQKKIEEIISMGKEPIIAVIERRGEVIYYKINRINFNENNERIENLNLF